MDDRIVPAAGSFQLSDGGVGSVQFSTPDGVDPGQGSQHLTLSDLTISVGGQNFIVTGTATADYQYGVLSGVTATATGDIDFSGLTLADGDVTHTTDKGTGSGTVVYDTADTQTTFTLPDGTTGTISFTIPDGPIDPYQSSQSLSLSNFNINIAGQNVNEATTTFTTTPTAQFENGALVGLTFAVNTSALGFGWNSLSMSGDWTLSAVQTGTNQLFQVNALQQKSKAETNTATLEFDLATTGMAYNIQVKVYGSSNPYIQLAQTITVNVQATDTASQIRNRVDNSLRAAGIFEQNVGTTEVLIGGNTKKSAAFAADFYAVTKIEFTLSTSTDGSGNPIPDNTICGPTYQKAGGAPPIVKNNGNTLPNP